MCLEVIIGSEWLWTPQQLASALGCDVLDLVPIDDDELVADHCLCPLNVEATASKFGRTAVQDWDCGGAWRMFKRDDAGRVEVKRLEAEIAKLEKLKDKLLQEWADENCPFKVGDIVVICGYSYEGRRGRVISVTSYEGFKGHEWSVECVVLKADGTDSKHTAIFRQHQWKASKYKNTPPQRAETA